jgi:hypothetical protein
MEPEAVLDRFTAESPENAEAGPAELSQGYWQRMERLIRSAVSDNTAEESKRLSLALHELQVQNQLLSVENEGLRDALTTKRKRKKGKVLDLQQREEYHGGAVFWSPRKIREARAREVVIEKEAYELRLQKANDKELKAAATLYKQKIQEERLVARERAKVVREKERVEKATERARKQEALNTKRAIQQSQLGKMKASQALPPKNKRQKRSGDGATVRVVPAPPPSPPPRTTTRGRNVKFPHKFR